MASLRPQALALLLSPVLVTAAAAGAEQPEFPGPSVGLEIRDSHVSLQARINGRPVRLGLDTGASGALWLAPRLARELALPVVGQAEADDGSGRNTRLIDRVQVETMKLGEVVFRDLKAPVLEPPPDAAGSGLAVDGFLGFELFRGYTVTLNYPQRTLHFSRQALAAQADNPLLTFRMDQGTPTIPLQVGGQTWPATLDSGAMSGIMLPLAAMDSLPMKSPPVVVGRMETLFNTFDVLQGTLQGTVRMGDLTLPEPLLTFAKPLTRANIGRDVLHRMVLTFDMPHLRLRLEAVDGAGEATAPPPDRSQRGEDWPTFLGARADGRSRETGILTAWGEEGLPLIWHLPAGEGYAPPAVADGRLFLFHRVGDTARLDALHAITGRQLWSAEYTTSYEDLYGFSNGPRASPVVDGDRVYTFGAEGRLRAHGVQDGRLLWEVDTAREFGVVQNFFGAASVPVVEKDLLIAAIGGSPADAPAIQSGRVTANGSALVAFDKHTGEVRYRSGDHLASYSSPVITTLAGRRMGLYFARSGLLGFEPSSGRIDFHFPFRARKLESVNASNPVVVDDTVFITESYGPGSALVRITDEGFQVLRQDTSRRQQSMSCHFMTPIHHQGYLYGSSGQGSGEAMLRAVEYETGRIMWEKAGLGRVTLLYADGHLLVYTERGRLLLVEATPEAFRLKAEFTPQMPGGSGEETDPSSSPGGRALLPYPAWAPPVLSHGVLYLRAKGRLAAFQWIPGAASSDAPRPQARLSPAQYLTR